MAPILPFVARALSPGETNTRSELRFRAAALWCFFQALHDAEFQVGPAQDSRTSAQRFPNMVESQNREACRLNCTAQPPPNDSLSLGGNFLALNGALRCTGPHTGSSFGVS